MDNSSYGISYNCIIPSELFKVENDENDVSSNLFLGDRKKFVALPFRKLEKS